MHMRLMITNEGPHPADKWADMTTEAILDLVQVVEDSVTPEATAARAAKRNLRSVLFDIFNDHHTATQSSEQRHLTAKIKTADQARARAEVPLNVELNSQSLTLHAVFEALAATPFAAHFAKPEVRAVVTQIIGQHTADVMHIERCWHRDGLVAKEA